MIFKLNNEIERELFYLSLRFKNNDIDKILSRVGYSLGDLYEAQQNDN